MNIMYVSLPLSSHDKKYDAMRNDASQLSGAVNITVRPDLVASIREIILGDRETGKGYTSEISLVSGMTFLVDLHPSQVLKGMENAANQAMSQPMIVAAPGGAHLLRK